MSDTRPAPTTPPAGFSRLWRWLLPLGLGIVGLAVALGVFDETGRPALIFAAGVIVVLIGVVSLANHLFDLGRREVRELEQRLEDELDKRGRG